MSNLDAQKKALTDAALFDRLSPKLRRGIEVMEWRLRHGTRWVGDVD